MSWRERLKSWILADPEQSTLYDAIDLELSRREPWRLDTMDGVGGRSMRLPECLERSPELWACGLDQDHNGDHMAWDCRGDLMAVWAASLVDGGDTDETDMRHE